MIDDLKNQKNEEKEDNKLDISRILQEKESQSANLDDADLEAARTSCDPKESNRKKCEQERKVAPGSRLDSGLKRRLMLSKRL